MTSMARKQSKGRAAEAAPPAWRLPEVPPQPGPPGIIWKWLLAAVIVLQAAWIAALVWMAWR
jgi:hypothetical protein